jgi:hypothetical protein
MSTPDAAHHLAHASQNLSQDMGLINGQPGLTGIAAATDVTRHLAWVTEQIGLQAQLLGEFIRAEVEAGRVEPHPGVTTEVDVTTSKGLVFLGVNSATAAADAAARALHGIHGLLADLATKDNLPERIGVDPAMRSKGFALNLLHASVLGDYPTVQTLAERMSADDAADLIATLKATIGYLGAPHGFNAASQAEQPDG